MHPADTDRPPAPAEVSLPSPGGLVLEPFQAERFDPTRTRDLAAVTSPPYDVIDEDGVRRLEQADPHNVVRLILPREPDPAADGTLGARTEPVDRYERAAATLAAWRRDGTLVRDPDPALYVYEETDAGHVQRGLLGAVGLVDPDDGIILPHENTMAGPVADRLALTRATAANLEPIFLVYDGGGAASEAVTDALVRPPLLTVTTEDGVEHRLWRIDEPAVLADIAGDLRPRRAVIADGHHRYATYLQHQRDKHEAGAGSGRWDYGLALLVDASAFGPQVHAIHRVIPSLPVAEAVARAGAAFAVRRVDGSTEAALDALAVAGRDGASFVIAGDGSFWLLTEPDPMALAAALPAARSPAWRGLDVTVAHLLLIRRVWGLEDNEGVVDYRHDVAAALAAATSSGGTALLLNPTPVEDVLAVAAAGERMPRKSTLFTPKPRTGLVLRPLD
ncbi:MAG: DUF1015 domain-containing protein [Actinomycetota bacterium]|nr:DUF1015 domain-containing protein [Actinomycetota bacterium]